MLRHGAARHIGARHIGRHIGVVRARQIGQATGGSDVSSKKIGFIGAGKMGEAMISGMLSGSFSPSDIYICDPNKKRVNYMEGKYSISSKDSASELGAASDIIILAIKPQQLIAVGAELREVLPEDSLLLSILAGATLEDLELTLGTRKVVRVMPNTPASVGQAMSVWIAASISEEDRESTSCILSSFGEQLQVKDESYMDMATALSASGVAYFFLMMESMIDAGVHLGCPRDMSKHMVLQTMLGSVLYAMQSDTHVAQLKNDITSPGGTTAAALYAAEKGGFKTVVTDSVWAAYRRSLELGGKSSHVGPGTSTNGRF